MISNSQALPLKMHKKQRFGEIKLRTSELSTKFSENVLDSTQAWQKHISDADELAGMPELALAAAEQAAKAKGLDGYLLTLEFPSYLPVMSYCANRELRREVYTAFATRASDTIENKKWDNSPIIEELLALRLELANVLDFDSYAHYSLATKMAQTPDEVLGFLNKLAEQSVTTARSEFDSLAQFAKETDNIGHLEAWDVGYYSEKLKKKINTPYHKINYALISPWIKCSKVCSTSPRVYSTSK